MAGDDTPVATPSGTDVSDLYSEYYYAHDCGIAYERNDHWTRFFGSIAERIIASLAPTSVLDAGCAIGLLVEQLRDRGVDAAGIDISDWAIGQVPDALKPHCRVGSLTEPLGGRYDLVVCIEVVEHIATPGDRVALANLTAVTDRILLSSSPYDYAEPTHVSVRPAEQWAEALAEHGFVHDLDYDASYLTPWAALYVRRAVTVPETVRIYERTLFRAREESHQLRERVLTMQRRLKEVDVPRRPDASDEEVLALRNEVVAATTELGEARGRVRELEEELRRHQLAFAEVRDYRRARGFAAFDAFAVLRRGVGALVRRVRGLFGK